MDLTLRTSISKFGAESKAKLSNPASRGEPEDKLRAPLESLLENLTELCGMPRSAIASVGGSALRDLKTRPDYAIVVRGGHVGFVEVKAPGKGADPRKFRDRHDKAQWDKLKLLPNLIDSDGHGFSLFD